MNTARILEIERREGRRRVDLRRARNQKTRGAPLRGGATRVRFAPDDVNNIRAFYRTHGIVCVGNGLTARTRRIIRSQSRRLTPTHDVREKRGGRLRCGAPTVSAVPCTPTHAYAECSTRCTVTHCDQRRCPSNIANTLPTRPAWRGTKTCCSRSRGKWKWCTRSTTTIETHGLCGKRAARKKWNCVLAPVTSCSCCRTAPSIRLRRCVVVVGRGPFSSLSPIRVGHANSSDSPKKKRKPFCEQAAAQSSSSESAASAHDPIYLPTFRLHFDGSSILGAPARGIHAARQRLLYANRLQCVSEGNSTCIWCFTSSHCTNVSVGLMGVLVRSVPGSSHKMAHIKKCVNPSAFEHGGGRGSKRAQRRCILGLFAMVAAGIPCRSKWR